MVRLVGFYWRTNMTERLDVQGYLLPRSSDGWDGTGQHGTNSERCSPANVEQPPLSNVEAPQNPLLRCCETVRVAVGMKG